MSLKNSQTEVTVAYFRANLPRLLELAQKGKVIRILRYNKPIATLSPPVPDPKPVRRFGTGKGRVKIIDPHWADPMTDAEVDAWLEGRY